MSPSGGQVPSQERTADDREANRSVSTLRAAVERAIANLKDWKIFATRCRGPLTRFTLVAKTVTASPSTRRAGETRE
ncbi:transposase family protein [Streptomyces globisporus]|uniref:transposase family protein n=1 Tax=Streptomyces globisporus TaxID=1908 RepID=UPI002F911DD5